MSAAFAYIPMRCEKEMFDGEIHKFRRPTLSPFPPMHRDGGARARVLRIQQGFGHCRRGVSRSRVYCCTVLIPKNQNHELRFLFAALETWNCEE